MKKLLERLKEFNTPLYYGIACLVFGVAFTVLPYLWKPALDILLVIAGIFSIFVGILTVSLLDTEYRGIGYYLSDTERKRFKWQQQSSLPVLYGSFRWHLSHRLYSREKTGKSVFLGSSSGSL